jgi:hypothetical protein
MGKTPNPKITRCEEDEKAQILVGQCRRAVEIQLAPWRLERRLSLSHARRTHKCGKRHSCATIGELEADAGGIGFEALSNESRRARVAKLADAPDLGLRFCRFHDIAFRFKANSFYEGKSAVLPNRAERPNSEQNWCHSSTNPSTQASDRGEKSHFINSYAGK